MGGQNGREIAVIAAAVLLAVAASMQARAQTGDDLGEYHQADQRASPRGEIRRSNSAS